MTTFEPPSPLSPKFGRLRVVVAIPVKNEGERIAACLDALGGQNGIASEALGILLFLNNCTDRTRDIAEAWGRDAATPLRIVEQNSAEASAGWARRMAMEAGAAWLGEGGTLMTTDADSRVAADWVARNLAALARGADVVAGRIAFDLGEIARWPTELREWHRLEETYEMRLAEIEARLDPQPGNPWPTHWTKSGATIAMRLDAYRKVGGVPHVADGEDHALIDACRACGLVVRQATDIVVTTSSRLDGRAGAGAADTLRRRGETLTAPCAPRLERVARAVLRILRQRGSGDHRSSMPYRPVRPAQLPRQISRARLLLAVLRLFGPRRTSNRYASVRELCSSTAGHAAAAATKASAASSPLSG